MKKLLGVLLLFSCLSFACLLQSTHETVLDMQEQGVVEITSTIITFKRSKLKEFAANEFEKKFPSYTSGYSNPEIQRMAEQRKPGLIESFADNFKSDIFHFADSHGLEVNQIRD